MCFCFSKKKSQGCDINSAHICTIHIMMGTVGEGWGGDTLRAESAVLKWKGVLISIMLNVDLKEQVLLWMKQYL